MTTNSSSLIWTRGRIIIAGIGGLLAAGTVWWMVENSLLQICLVLGFFALVIEAALVVTAWRKGALYLVRREGLRFWAWFFIGCVSVVVLYYAEESWRGRRTWAAALRESSARGETLSTANIIPPAVPDDQNFLTAPGVARALGLEGPEPGTNSSAILLSVAQHRHRPPPLWICGKVTDFGAWLRFQAQETANAASLGKVWFPTTNGNRWFPFPRVSADEVAKIAQLSRKEQAEVLLAALEPFEADFQLLRQAAGRPASRFPVDYSQGPLPMFYSHLPRFQNVAGMAQLLCLRASAHLAVDRSDAALDDLLLALRLADALQSEPFPVAHALRAESLVRAFQPLWEGLADHRFSGSQLDRLDEWLQHYDALADAKSFFRRETLQMVGLVEALQSWVSGQPSPMEQMTASGTPEHLIMGVVRWIYPSGWLYQDKAWLCRNYLQQPDPFSALQLSQRPGRDWRRELRQISDPLLIIYLVPRIREILQTGMEQGLFLHTATAEARVAIALEHYHLAQGDYPASLDALVPKYLPEIPADLLSPPGNRLKYVRANRTFSLYSVGLNRMDDHGALPPQPDPTHYSFVPVPREGDWVWPEWAQLSKP